MSDATKHIEQKSARTTKKDATSTQTRSGAVTTTSARCVADKLVFPCAIVNVNLRLLTVAGRRKFFA